MNENSKLQALRLQIRALEGSRLETAGDRRLLPFAGGELNAPLPQGGLQLGALHEFCAGGLESELAPAVTAFAATIAAQILRRQDGFLLWAASLTDCYAPGLARLGLEPSRIVWVDCAKETDVLSVMEEALHSRALAAVLGEAGALSLKTARRLDAAARQSGVTALLLRRHRSRPSKAAASPSGAAATRWRVSAVPGVASRPPQPVLRPPSSPWRACNSAWPHPQADAAGRRTAVSPSRPGQNGPPSPHGERGGVRGDFEPGVGLPRWRLDLEYCRNGRTASWIVEVSDGANGDDAKAGDVRVAAELCDDARTPEAAPARKAGSAARSS
ncbi:MAG: ImuA family protein [Rhodomicrobium sp.]